MSRNVLELGPHIDQNDRQIDVMRLVLVPQADCCVFMHTSLAGGGVVDTQDTVCSPPCSLLSSAPVRMRTVSECNLSTCRLRLFIC